MTDKYRYRPQTRLFRAPLLVLQIGKAEVRDSGRAFAGETYIEWRDATFEDLAIAEITPND